MNVEFSIDFHALSRGRLCVDPSIVNQIGREAHSSTFDVCDFLTYFVNLAMCIQLQFNDKSSLAACNYRLQ